MTVASMDITTETDLLTGNRTFSAELSPVPIVSPVGLAPGRVVVTAEPAGRIVALALELHPHPAIFRGAAGKLAALADWPLDVDALERLPVGQQPVVRLVLGPDQVAALGVRMVAPEEFGAVMDDPLVGDAAGYRLDAITTES